MPDATCYGETGGGFISIRPTFRLPEDGSAGTVTFSIPINVGISPAEIDDVFVCMRAMNASSMTAMLN